MGRRVMMTGAACLMLMLPVGSSRAQPTAADIDTARAHFRHGRSLAEAGDWAGARDAFAASLDIVPRVSVLLSLATAEVHLGHGQPAIRALDTLVALADPVRDEAHLQAAAQVRAHAESLLAQAPPRHPEDSVEEEPVTVPRRSQPPETAAPITLEESRSTADRTAPTPAPADADQAPGLVSNALGVVLLSLGAAALGVAGVAFAVREDALRERDALCPNAVCADESSRQSAIARHADASTWTDASNALWVGGAVALTGGAILLILGLSLDASAESSVSVAPRVGPTFAGLSVEGTAW